MIWICLAFYLFGVACMFSAFSIHFGADDSNMRPYKIVIFSLLWPYTLTVLIFLRLMEAK